LGIFATKRILQTLFYSGLRVLADALPFASYAAGVPMGPNDVRPTAPLSPSESPFVDLMWTTETGLEIWTKSIEKAKRNGQLQHERNG
jgi:hypothetical protein